MAANTSFKVTCPSCEASIPIRDPKLIGRKVDCPKCKYRFVVEDPGAEADDAPAPAKSKGARGDRARPKKKQGSNNMLILGSVLGVAALAILAVGGYVLFAGGGDSSKASTPIAGVTPPPLATTPPGDAPPADPDNPDAPAPGAVPAVAGDAPPTITQAPSDKPPPPAPGGVYKDVSNLLHPDAQAVLMIDMDRMRNSTLGQQAFESRVGFRQETFKTKMGIGVEEMARYVRAENFEQKWSFNAIRTKGPVKLSDLRQAMGLKKGPKSPIQGREYYEVPPNDLLDNLGGILQSELESKEAKPGEARRPAQASTPLGLLLLDPTTVVIANLDVLEEFLNVGCKYELKSRPAQGAGEGDNPGAPPADAPGGGRGIQPLPPPGGPGGPGGGRDAAEGGEGGQGPQFAAKATYLTIDPSLKSMMDRLEDPGEQNQQVIAAAAQRLQSNPVIVQRLREATTVKDLELRGMNVLGVGLYDLNVEKFKGLVILDWFREGDARTFEEALKKVMQPAGMALGLFLGGMRIDVEGGEGGNTGFGGPFGPGGGFGPGGVPGDPQFPGGVPGDPQFPGGVPGDPNQQGQGQANAPRSKIALSRQGRAVRFEADLALNERAYDKIYALTEGAVIRMKGLVEMADSQPRWHELAAAAKALPKDGVVPRATFPRDEPLGSRISRTYPPNQRVGWTVGLLPYLGQEDLYNRIEKRKSWRSEENLKHGAVLVSQFLNPRFPRASWRANVPSLGVRDQGATHYVGMAGIGLDAADYRANDPAVQKKLGMFGHNRQTDLKKDVTDGQANTVMMIMVPPTYPRPWIAGGGATVQGVPESGSVQPFLAQHGGKRGTYVLMADGTVRFVSDTISDDVFKALCTIKGGEEIPDLNKQAPKVDPPKGSEIRTAQGQ
jgi:predicted Zn finger-like uncharacterized protein